MKRRPNTSAERAPAEIRVGMISLGCAKNLVDGEVMLGHLQRAGVRITADAATADVVVVNTCGFINDAKRESIDAILEVADAKGASHIRELHVEILRDKPGTLEHTVQFAQFGSAGLSGPL